VGVRSKHGRKARNRWRGSIVGERLRAVRLAKNLSLRALAKKISVDFAVLHHIETWERFPPTCKGKEKRLEEFANLLELSVTQLRALIAVERRRLNPHELLPELDVTPLREQTVELKAQEVLDHYVSSRKDRTLRFPVPVVEILSELRGIRTIETNFAEEATLAGENCRSLYGCFFPVGRFFKKQENVILVNSGAVCGRQLTIEQKLVTVAHEAGHFFLHCTDRESAQLTFKFTKEPTFCSTVGDRDLPFDAREHQATVFAACLLMPREEFSAASANADAVALAQRFGVTPRFVRFRKRMLTDL